MGDWTAIEPLFADLRGRVISSAAELEAWLHDSSELAACLGEEGSRRYVAMTQRTDDAEREAAYLAFVRDIQPRLKPLWFALQQRFVSSPHRGALPRDRYFVYARDAENEVTLFRDENVPLQTRETELQQRYQKLTGAWTAIWRGEERTMQQMAKLLEEPDRATREAAWRAMADRRFADAAALEDLYDELLALRARIARNAGFADYRAYAFRNRGRFDYAPADCEAFHEAVASHVLPVVRALNDERIERLGVKRLRPWDLAVDPANQAPLRPFDDMPAFVDRAARVFDRVDADLGEQFRFMADRGLLDLESRKGKAPGGYQSTMHERRLPFIFMNAVGVSGDVRTLLHEGGHAFHALACREDPLTAYRRSPLEFAEVASMGMELLAVPHLEVFYPDPGDRARANVEFFEDIARILPWIATIDAFQHWIYTNEGHTREARRDAWLRTFRRFHPGVDWDGLESQEAARWHYQLHLFTHPFYYIEYGIAQLGALQLWLAARKDYSGAVQKYRAALALGGSRPLPALFEAAGLRFDFGPETVAPLARALDDSLRGRSHEA
jgi:oligoendopeptidase F